PRFFLLGELLSSFFCQGIELRAASVLRFAPRARHETVRLEAVERGKERPGLDLESALGHLLNAVGDAEAVQRPQRERSQDQQFERSLQERRLRGRSHDRDYIDGL